MRLSAAGVQLLHGDRQADEDSRHGGRDVQRDRAGDDETSQGLELRIVS